MAADLTGTGVTVNLLAPGGATATGMVPEDLHHDVLAKLLDPSIVGPRIRWLASADSDGITDQRIVATEFADGVRPTARSPHGIIESQFGHSDHESATPTRRHERFC